MTTHPVFLKLPELNTGAQVELCAKVGELVAKPAARLARKRYSAEELLKGSEHVAELNTETAWAREGRPFGHEII